MARTIPHWTPSLLPHERHLARIKNRIEQIPGTPVPEVPLLGSKRLQSRAPSLDVGLLRRSQAPRPDSAPAPSSRS